MTDAQPRCEVSAKVLKNYDKRKLIKKDAAHAWDINSGKLLDNVQSDGTRSGGLIRIGFNR